MIAFRVRGCRAHRTLCTLQIEGPAAAQPQKLEAEELGTEDAAQPNAEGPKTPRVAEASSW